MRYPIKMTSIDPGLLVTGWAFWEGDRLVKCGLSKAPKKATFEDRVLFHVNSIVEDLPPSARVCERMIARGKFSPVDAQDLIDLNLTAGALGQYWVTPAEWKGSVPRTVEQQRTIDALTLDELEMLMGYKRNSGDGHNVWSAVGIGLSVVGRAHVGKIAGKMFFKWGGDYGK